ncbi:MAG: hypothetical protein M1831_001051 [Alyxoria varia]|nr:MAG: hypothetical protein M1831_001051 [Alyxoria varia]
MTRKKTFKSLLCFSSAKDVGGWDFRDPTPTEFRRAASTVRPAHSTTAKFKEKARAATTPLFGASADANDESGVAFGAMSVGSPGLFTGSAPRPSNAGPTRPATADPAGKHHTPPPSRQSVRTPGFPSKESAKPGGRPPRRTPPVAPIEEYKREHRDHYGLAVPESLWARAERNAAKSSGPEGHAQPPKATSLKKKPSQMKPPPPYPKRDESSRTGMPTSARKQGEDSTMSNAVRASRSMPAMRPCSTRNSSSSGNKSPMHFSMRSREPPTRYSRDGTPTTSARASIDGEHADSAQGVHLEAQSGENGEERHTNDRKEREPGVSVWPMEPGVEDK